MKFQASIVTGGIGFIGSHLTMELVKEGSKVLVIDNFSSGKTENLKGVLEDRRLTIVRKDLKEKPGPMKAFEECEVVFHLAANPEIRIGETEPKVHFEENILATFNLLELIRQAKTQKTIVFTSTSTVYGEPSQIPTPENYGPLIPLSTYGASKLACEALITSYAYTFNHKALILRLANVIGKRSTHGVVYDFIKKIKTNPNQLDILGDGTQEKSYLHIDDCIEAIIHLTNHFIRNRKKVEIYNVGSIDKIGVQKIAMIVAREMKQPNIHFNLTGGVDGGRGWKSDIKTMQLSIEKALQTGWKPRYTSRQAVKLAAKELAVT